MFQQHVRLHIELMFFLREPNLDRLLATLRKAKVFHRLKILAGNCILVR